MQRPLRSQSPNRVGSGPVGPPISFSLRFGATTFPVESSVSRIVSVEFGIRLGTVVI